MVKGCVNGKLDEHLYAAPVKIIGWYIAVGSAVCFLFMLFDVCSAIRRKQRWIPCRIFPLNSITLSLLAIISKVPVDLTTPMPSVHDQLSKLTATTMICSCIGFMAPSVANSSGYEYIANMASLTVFVVTVVVNVCIQLYTGVIQLFIEEHIIIMCCMLSITMLLWYCASEVKAENEDLLVEAKNQFKIQVEHGDDTLFQRMSVSYVDGFRLNPQLRSCKNINYCSMAVFCIVCCCVTIQASVKSIALKRLKLCANSDSDYGVSVWIVLVIQILTILLGCSATSFRWFKFFIHDSFKKAFPLRCYSDKSIKHILRTEPMFRASWWQLVWMPLQDAAWFVVLSVRALTIMPTLVASKAYRAYVSRWRTQAQPSPPLGRVPGAIDHVVEDVGDAKHVVDVSDAVKNAHPDGHPDTWAVKKVANFRAELTKGSILYHKPSKTPHLVQLIGRTRPSQGVVAQQYDPEQPFEHFRLSQCTVSSLTMAMLVRISTLCFTSDLTTSMEQCFHEAYETIRFIEDQLNYQIGSNRTESRLAKNLLNGGGFDVYLPQIKSSCPNGSYDSLSELGRANHIINSLPTIIAKTNGNIAAYMTQIIDILKEGRYETVNELYLNIEQLFVDMLHLHYTCLPMAILKKMSESSTESFSDNARRMMKLIIQIGPSEYFIAWSKKGINLGNLFFPDYQRPLKFGLNPSDDVRIEVEESS